MSYISGNIGTFISRMHQTPTGLFELSGNSASYWLEMQSYRIIADAGLQTTWNREFSNKYYEITKTGISQKYIDFVANPAPILSGAGSMLISYNSISPSGMTGISFYTVTNPNVLPINFEATVTSTGLSYNTSGHGRYIAVFTDGISHTQISNIASV